MRQLTPLEKQVWELAQANKGIGTIVETVGKPERIIQAAYNRAWNKMSDWKIEQSQTDNCPK